MRNKISWLDRNLSKSKVSNAREINRAKTKRLSQLSKKFPRRFLLTSKISPKEVWMMTCSTTSPSILSQPGSKFAFMVQKIRMEKKSLRMLMILLQNGILSLNFQNVLQLKAVLDYMKSQTTLTLEITQTKVERARQNAFLCTHELSTSTNNTLKRHVQKEKKQI